MRRPYWYILLVFVTPLFSFAAPLSTTTIFSHNLSRGMTSPEVSALQQCLKTDPSIYPEGIVSGYFGVLTEKAVQQFQIRTAIVFTGTPRTTGFGRVGPKTKKVLNEFCTTVSQVSLPTQPQPTLSTQLQPTTTVVPTLPAQPQVLPTGTIETYVPSTQEQKELLDEWKKINVNTPLSVMGPGNCSTIQQCIDYCAIPKNSSECFGFVK